MTSILLGHRLSLELQARQGTTADDSDDEDSLYSLNSTSSFHEAEFRLSSVVARLDSLYKLAAKIRNPRNRPQRPTAHLYKYIPEEVCAQYKETQEQIEIALVAFVQQQNLRDSVTEAQVRELGISRTDLTNLYASPTKWLVRRIGIANARRKQQFIYWAKHAESLALDTTTEVSVGEDMQIPTLPSGRPASGPPAQSLATSATKLTKVNYTGPDDLKSAISHHSRVTTVVSPKGEKLVWPPPPSRLAGTKFFVCPYCRVICPAAYLSRDEWRIHQINDLQPYQCTYEDCPDPNRLYGQREEWIDHENQHRRVWHCDTHGREFETQPEYLRHVKEEHQSEEQGPSVTQAACVVSSSSKPHRDCPLCPTAFSDVVQMREHMRYHLERLALFALPDVEDEAKDNLLSAGSSGKTRVGERRGRQDSVDADFGQEERRLFRAIDSEFGFPSTHGYDKLEIRMLELLDSEYREPTSRTQTFQMERWLEADDEAGGKTPSPTAMIYDSISAYCLLRSDLEEYLRNLFPGQEVEVTVRAYRI